MPATPITDFVLNGITFKILTEYAFDYSLDQNGPKRTVTYSVPGDKAVDACNALKGIGVYNGKTFQFPQPHKYPNNENIQCVGVKLCTHLGGDAPSQFLMESGGDVALTANYEALLWSPFGDDFADILGMNVPWSSVRIDGSHEDHGASDILGADGNILKRLRVRVPLITYQFSRTMIPAVLPYKTICAGLVEKVNTATWFGESRGTVRFDSFSMSEEDRDPSGQRVWTFTTNFSWRPIDWNKQLIEGQTNSWQYPSVVGNYPYVYTDFTPLLTYGIS